MTAPRNRIIALFAVLACTAAAQQAQSQQEKQGGKEKEENVTKDSKDIDEIVNQPIAALHRALKLGMETYGFEIKKDKPDYLEGTRDRKVGVVIGSGGESEVGTINYHEQWHRGKGKGVTVEKAMPEILRRACQSGADGVMNVQVTENKRLEFAFLNVRVTAIRFANP